MTNVICGDYGQRGEGVNAAIEPTFSWSPNLRLRSRRRWPGACSKRFDFVRLNRSRRFGDQDIVFQSHSEAFFADVDGGLDGHDPAGLHRFSSEADVVNIQSEGM